MPTEDPVHFHLVGAKDFVRHNPMSDRFEVRRFHSIEFWCADATNTYKRFQHGLGMTLVAKSDLSTENEMCASFVLQSNDLVFAFTAPYARKVQRNSTVCPLPGYDLDTAYNFVNDHGLGVRAVSIEVADAAVAYERFVTHGGVGVHKPVSLKDQASGASVTAAEVKLYGDVVLRFLSGEFLSKGPFLPNYQPTPGQPVLNYGLGNVDHAVGNVHELIPAVDYLANALGFHEFAEFVADDVGTLDSGLNSMVLASNNEMVLLPVNEPTFGTKRKSQIQNFLEQNEGPGLQHLALKTADIFHTVREMRARSDVGGFEFMPRASDHYYRTLPEKIGSVLTPEQYRLVEELGILVDRDDQGVLLQLFTKPLGDRPTIFIEVIQRIGCMRTVRDEETQAERVEQAGGCGGFGKGNFRELFKSIEDYERTLFKE